MARVAVLGASGWLGSALLAHLSDAHPSLKLHAPARQELEEATPGALRDLLRPDTDLAVVNAVGVIRGDDAAIERANLDFVDRLVTALESEAAHLVQIGSAAEYGDPGSASPVPETQPAAPLTLYGCTKWEATQRVTGRSDWVVLRPFNGIDRMMTVINPLREIRDKVRAVRRSGGDVELWSAETTRDHVSRGFLVHSLAHAALERSAGVFNLCSGVGLSYRRITEAMAEVSGGRLPIRDLRREAGIPAVVGDPAAWSRETGLAEALTARQVAELVMSG